MLIKGITLFVAFGLLCFFLVLGVEYFLWLGSTGRLGLLLLLIAVEVFLVYRYIATPLFYLFKLKKGISNKEASRLIGRHFGEVGDKLYNLLDLSEDAAQSELLLASIEQRSRQLSEVSFLGAIAYKDNLRYVKYLLVPLLLFAAIAFSGNLGSFFGSAKRVVNYDLAYEPPAPFRFQVLNDSLEVLDTDTFTIRMGTIGTIRPETVYIEIDGKQALLTERNGNYQYRLPEPLQSTSFSFVSNEVRSPEYRLNVLKTPAMEDFSMRLDYPRYTGRANKRLQGTGNATVPEGTRISWEIRGRDIESVKWTTRDTAVSFQKVAVGYRLNKRLFRTVGYEISTGNQNVNDYERLGYRIKVVKDAFPTIKVNKVIDSLTPNVAYFSGEATDDYALKKTALVYFPSTDTASKKRVPLESPKGNYQKFYYTYPSGMDLKEDTEYRFYFEVTDNDAVHGGKATKSEVFTMALLNQDQLMEKDLRSRETLINSFDKSMERYQEQKNELGDINKLQKEKKELNFNDKSQIKQFLNKQKNQEQMMQKLSTQLKENLKRTERDDKLNKLLQERLERQEKKALKNAKLIEELQKVADKINQEELSKRLEELGKKQRTGERSLEQLLELTKRYYVTEKMAQLSKALEKMATEQENMAKKEGLSKEDREKQEDLQKAFKSLTEELKELQKDNDALKKPLELKVDEKKKTGVERNQKEAVDMMKAGEEQTDDKQKPKAISGKQQSAAEKMKEMAKELQQSASGSSGGSSVAEDAEMLRQILDNLVIFSFKQEGLFETLESIDQDGPQYSGVVRKQKELRVLFEHVDDSLFSLSLRQPELSEYVDEQVTEVYYNMDKALDNLAESQVYQSVSYQKYVLNASNGLADFLAKLLDNMNQSMKMGQGQGESSEGFQLPDIIKEQGAMKKKMEGMGKDGKQGEGEKEDGQKGEGQGKGEDGKQGQQKGGKEGNGGEDGDKKGEGSNGNGEGDQKGDKKGKGPSGNGSGNGNQLGEKELEELYEIYKQQQEIRAALEKQLQDMINASDRKLGEKLLRQMQDFEDDLLENGITTRSMQKVNNIQYELLKLENAAMKQGKKKERESTVNDKKYQNPITTKPKLLEEFKNEIELLNRQALPLRPDYKEKVKEYFRANDQL